MAKDAAYGVPFFREVESESALSSRELIPYLLRFVNPKSVLDVGCGTGFFLRSFMDMGVIDILGLDGDYVPRDMLRIPEEQFIVHDLESEFVLDRRYDLVMCLEVAEHVSDQASDSLIKSLVRHGDLIAFSAAVPGQGGTNHVNERYLSYWHEKFSAQGYEMADILRPLIWDREKISWFYRQNLVFFVRKGSIHEELLENYPYCPIQDIVHPHIFNYKNDLARQLDGALLNAGIQTLWENGVLVGIKDNKPLSQATDVKTVGSKVRPFPPYLMFPSVCNKRGQRKSICILTRDIQGPIRNGGIGTAYFALAKTLANAGHRVSVFYTLGNHCETESMDHWVREFAKLGVRLVPMPLYIGPELDTSYYTRRSYEVFQWLSRHESEFDIIHVPEWAGEAYYCLLARKQGIAFKNTYFCVGTHSPWMWHKLGNQTYVESLDDLEVDFLERECVRLADYVVSPSAYMLSWMYDNGWNLPMATYVEPNLIHESILHPIEPKNMTVDKVNKEQNSNLEFVFFGRLETRKGIEVFCDAITRSNLVERDDIMITFLGKHSFVCGKPSQEYINTEKVFWKCKVKIIDSFNSYNAISYLKRENVVAVIPSLVENSPYTVIECLHHKISFIASRVGGIPELIDSDSLDQVTFLPTPPNLAILFNRILLQGPPSPRASGLLNGGVERWNAWHDTILALPQRVEDENQIENRIRPLVSVCITHFNRPELLDQALESIKKQSYQNIEVIVVDDGSTMLAAKNALKRLEPEFAHRGWQIVYQENAYLGAARNNAARHARGTYLLFMDDDNVAKHNEVEIFVNIALKTNADILTCIMDVFSELEAPQANRKSTLHWVPLGNATAVGAVRNVFGDANALVKADAFWRVGGFTEDYGLGHEDWEFFSKASLMGLDIQVIPLALFWYRARNDSMVRTTNLEANNLRNIRPYIESMPKSISYLALLAQGYHYSERANSITRTVTIGLPIEMSGASPKDIAAQLQKSHSLVMTRPIRWFGKIFRRGGKPLEAYKFNSEDEALGFIHMVLNSTSWNMTAPFREVRRIVRKLISRM